MAMTGSRSSRKSTSPGSRNFGSSMAGMPSGGGPPERMQSVSTSGSGKLASSGSSRAEAASVGIAFTSSTGASGSRRQRADAAPARPDAPSPPPPPLPPPVQAAATNPSPTMPATDRAALMITIPYVSEREGNPGGKSRHSGVRSMHRAEREPGEGQGGEAADEPQQVPLAAHGDQRPGVDDGGPDGLGQGPGIGAGQQEVAHDQPGPGSSPSSDGAGGPSLTSWSPKRRRRISVVSGRDGARRASDALISRE